MMMKCPKCGAEMNSESRVCPECGRKRLTGKDKVEIVLLIIFIFIGYSIITAMHQTGKRMDKVAMEGELRISAEYPVQEDIWTISSK